MKFALAFAGWIAVAAIQYPISLGIAHAFGHMAQLLYIPVSMLWGAAYGLWAYGWVRS